jgi:hypothetical protein
MINRRALGAFWSTLLLTTIGCTPADEYQDPVEGASQDLAGTFSLKVVSSGKCWDVPGSSTTNGTVLDQWSCHTAPNQQWQVKQVSGSVHQIISAGNSKCADVSGASTADGAKIIQWPCGSGKTNQQWKLISNGGGVYQLQSVKSGKCATVAGNSTANGATLEQQPCTNAQNQQFALSGTAGGGGAGGSPGTGGGPGTNPGTGGSSGGGGSGGNLVWRKANLTNFTSYPDPGSEECIKFNGCMWAGQFAFVNGTQPKSWVMSHNIAAVHQKDSNTYKLKTLRLKQGSHQIDVVVYDECADSDCSGCCTENAHQNGLNFLIDIESFTMQRFGTGDGIVDWACVDCN